MIDPRYTEKETGIVGRPRCNPTHLRPECAADLRRWPSPTAEKLDRLMNWVVGLLLVASVAALMVIQVSGPR
jgi:hypothetical protein